LKRSRAEPERAQAGETARRGACTLHAQFRMRRYDTYSRYQDEVSKFWRNGYRVAVFPWNNLIVQLRDETDHAAIHP
jgi:hypothetical protein